MLSSAALIFTIFTLNGCENKNTPAAVPEEISSSAAGEEQSAAQGTVSSVAFPYTSADSLNPFFMKTTLNSALVPFIYSSLYYLDCAFTAQRSIAAGERVTGASIEVSLSASAVFSDGSSVTAGDVAYSFSLAKSSVLYSGRLAGISACTAGEGGTVLFQPAYPDVNALSALSFPVVKQGTAQDSGSLPIGGGRYRFNQDGVRITLVSNENYGDAPQIGTIRLSDAGSNSSLEHLVDAGELDFCYSDLCGGAKRSYANITQIYLNNLVYLGVNSESETVGVAAVRRAISAGLSRQSIVTDAFQSYARAAALPFNTSWSALSECKSAGGISLSGDLNAANELLSPYGAGTDGKALYMKLICPDSNSFMKSAAALIKNQLAKLNISVEISFIGSDNYLSAIKGGEYDLYLAELKQPETMELSAFFTEGAAAAAGMNLGILSCDDNYFKYRSGEITLDAFCQSFLSELPFIPLCYRNARVCAGRALPQAAAKEITDIFELL